MRPPEKHFRVIWNISMLHVAILSALWIHELLGLSLFDPTLVIRDLAIWAMAWFLAPEWAAGGVKRGLEGTKTGFLYWTVTDRWPRVLLGVWMGQLVMWNFPNDAFGSPDWLPLGYIAGVGLTLWLPPHYWASGTKGPVDRFFGWLGGRLGYKKFLKKIRG
jgi:hypothetical protein